MSGINKYLKWIVIVIMSFGVIGATASYSFAQDPSIEVEVSSKKVALGSAIQLTITVHGIKNVDRVQLPEIEGFDVKYLGPSTRVSIVNGQYSSSKSFVYSLYPLKVGKFEIPGSNVTLENKAFNLPAIPLEVVGSMNQTSVTQKDQQVSLKDKLFIVLKVPKQEVYLGEPLPIKVLLFVSGLAARDIQYPDLNNIGFTMADYERPQPYQQVVNGLRYDIVEFNTKIYPTRVGKLHIGPAKVECNILVQSAGRLGGRSSVFDDDFFNSIFDRHQKRPMTLESDEAVVNVLPLPEEGKPPVFSGAVGQFDFNVSVSPNQVKEGDPITLRTTILGKGNLAAIQMPTLPIDAGFKLYDPQIFEKDNVKKGEQVIIPESEDIKEVPALNFSYFDSSLKKYRTITKGPFPITVTKMEGDEDFKVVGLEGEFRSVIPDTLGEDIVFIKTKPGTIRVAGEAVYNNVLFYIVLLIISVLWGTAFLNFKRTHRMKTDVVYARRLRAPGQAKKGITKAKHLMSSGQAKKFYDTVFKTMQEYLGNKLHLSSGAVTFESVQHQLNAHNIRSNEINDIRTIFEECDMIRYASADIDEEEMKESYERLVHSIDHLERFLK